MELDELEPKKDTLEAEIKELLMPQDPNDDKNCILKSELVLGEMRQQFLRVIFGARTSASVIEEALKCR